MLRSGGISMIDEWNLALLHQKVTHWTLAQAQVKGLVASTCFS
jgi:hypothetical protein